MEFNTVILNILIPLKRQQYRQYFVRFYVTERDDNQIIFVMRHPEIHRAEGQQMLV